MTTVAGGRGHIVHGESRSGPRVKGAHGMSFVVRAFDVAADRPAALSFIAGAQAFEHAFEPNRRLDGDVAAEWFDALLTRVEAGRGRIFVAERTGRAIGWAIVIVETLPLYVVERERETPFIIELFVEEAERGAGVGRALIAACEEAARLLGFQRVMIGVLARNARAAGIYAEAGYEPYQVELTKRL
jgi:GNAT superfamily N-acetyltransferase